MLPESALTNLDGFEPKIAPRNIAEHLARRIVPVVVEVTIPLERFA